MADDGLCPLPRVELQQWDPSTGLDIQATPLTSVPAAGTQQQQLSSVCVVCTCVCTCMCTSRVCASPQLLQATAALQSRSPVFPPSPSLSCACPDPPRSQPPHPNQNNPALAPNHQRMLLMQAVVQQGRQAMLRRQTLGSRPMVVGRQNTPSSWCRQCRPTCSRC